MKRVSILRRADNADQADVLIKKEGVEHPFKLTTPKQRPSANQLAVLGWIEDREKFFSPEDVFAYIYAVTHSPMYRERYAEFLKIDFPRVPITSDRALFWDLVDFGRALTDLHLLRGIDDTAPSTTFPTAGNNLVMAGYPKYEQRYVYINPTQYFGVIPQDVWEFHIGGYQVCEKWLKDRRLRNLSAADILHYRKVVYSLSRTIEIMTAIDERIGSFPLP